MAFNNKRIIYRSRIIRLRIFGRQFFQIYHYFVDIISPCPHSMVLHLMVAQKKNTTKERYEYNDEWNGNWCVRDQQRCYKSYKELRNNEEWKEWRGREKKTHAEKHTHYWHFLFFRHFFFVTSSSLLSWFFSFVPEYYTTSIFRLRMCRTNILSKWHIFFSVFRFLSRSVHFIYRSNNTCRFFFSALLIFFLFLFAAVSWKKNTFVLVYYYTVMSSF